MDKLVLDLKKVTSYPEKTKKIEYVQTHISNVFIGDKYVYKLKKPVNFGFLDFSDIEKRKYYCNQEVKLNNRFSNDVYLGVIPVTFNGDKYSIDGCGEVVDYAVKMRRLSDDDLLKNRYKKGNISKNDINRIARAIADFHHKSERSKEIDKYGTMESIKFNTDENFEQTKEFIGISISKKQYHDLKDWTNKFFKNNIELFSKRVKNGKIRDCHGDLHMEHICLSDPIVIFDCIEFNDRFRYSDTASDIAFLLMDLEFNGGKQFSETLCKAYLTSAGEKDDDQIYDLINFYKVYRAYVRGKVTSFILKDTSVPDDKKNQARDTAQRYFALAYSYILED